MWVPRSLPRLLCKRRRSPLREELKDLIQNYTQDDDKLSETASQFFCRWRGLLPKLWSAGVL